MNLSSASSLERVQLCPESQVLPHYRSAGNRYSRRGQVMHGFLVQVAGVGRESAIKDLDPEFREACACIEMDQLPPATPEAYAYEVALAYDLETDTGRELARNQDRESAYVGKRPSEVVGTVDVLGLTDDAVIIYDYKTGWRWFNRIEENYQLMLYALAAARAYGKERAHLAIIRIDEDGHPYFLRGEVGILELDAFAQRLRDLDERIADLKLRALGGEEMLPTWGDHCQFCPALPNCPAHMKLARSMTDPEQGTGGLPPLNEGTAVDYVEALKRMKKVAERVEESLKLYAEQTPIDLGGGWWFGQHPFPNNVWDVAKALPILNYFLGEDAPSVVSAEVVKKRIEGVYRERKKTNKAVLIGQDTQNVMDALKDQGALSIVYSQPIGKHKRKAEQLTEGEPNGEGHSKEAGAAQPDVAGEALQGGAPGASPEGRQGA